MKIYYSDSPIPKQTTQSIFLAGPSHRDNHTLDWRIEAVRILKELDFSGEVFVPIPEKKFGGGHDDASWTYMNQIAWECEHRAIADHIVFWVARDIKGHMPGFTTNIEFGEDLASGKVMYGRPDTADKCRYLDERYSESKGQVYNDLKALLKATIDKMAGGAKRTEGEIYVPLFVWQHPEFQSWYAQLQKAGNRLDKASVLNQFRIPNGQLFSFTLSVNIWVEAEKRHKANEFVFFRKSVSSVVAYYPGTKHENFKTHVVLVREFRSPVNNAEGYVYELPSGSYHGADLISGQRNAQHEMSEETGVHIEELARFERVSQRQVAATLCAYQSEVYMVKLHASEFLALQDKAKFKTVHGLDSDGERTYVEVVALDKLYDYPVDYATIGMIYEALHKSEDDFM